MDEYICVSTLVALGAGIGIQIALILLAFFKNEILCGMNNAVKRVRKFFNLPT